ncbi:tetratricopeptide repeat protein [Kitasatospora sp. NPDC059146]|uniref:tetratricopeptide repeat protein n=1 Tax=unclassified Kitasatospora TaxID=2633591 RepID=UPI0036AAA3A0
MTSELSEARELFESGDPQGSMRVLRSAADRLPPAEVAPLLAGLARGAGFEDLAQASTALAARPGDAERLYDYGYACVERGIDAVAVPALREALRLVQAPPAAAVRTGLFRRRAKSQAAPQLGLRKVLLELVSALEGCERHGEALAVLREHDERLGDWPDRYLTVYNALMDGRIPLAREVFGAMSAPEGIWVGPGQRVGRMLERAAELPPVDGRDLRGWHYVLTGGLLTTLSPHGFEQGMTGRWAYLQDDFGHCHHGLERLRAVLAATGRTPDSVALLADRGSRALGLAAARLLGVPAAPFRPGTPGALVVAYDLNECDPAVVAQLNERAEGQLLFEHATCWTDPPAVTADVSTLLGQIVNAPWEPGLQFGEDGEPAEAGPDRRSAEELAEAILAAAPEAPEGDGGTPADPDAVLTAFAARAVGWPAAGPRDRVASAGPVRSSRFA